MKRSLNAFLLFVRTELINGTVPTHLRYCLRYNRLKRGSTFVELIQTHVWLSKEHLKFLEEEKRRKGGTRSKQLRRHLDGIIERRQLRAKR